MDRDVVKLPKDIEKENTGRGRLLVHQQLDIQILKEIATGELWAPCFDRARRRRAIERVTIVMVVSERRVCRVAGQHRSTQRRTAPPNPYRGKLVARMRELAMANPRRGRRYIMDLLRKESWSVGARLMKRPWRPDGLLVPQKRVKRRRIGTGENGIVRRRATRRNEVWGMEFVQD